MPGEDKLAFAYKYPFSDEAKEVVSGMRVDPGSTDYNRLAKARIEEGLEKGTIAYKALKYGQEESVAGYAFARLMISALPEHAIWRYALAEARRSTAALASDTNASVVKLASELGISVHEEKGFLVDVITFLKNCPEGNEYALANQKLSNGYVGFDRQGISGMLQKPIQERIRKGLPIPKKEIPKETLNYAKEVRIPQERSRHDAGPDSLAWIDRLLSNPIPDVRKRVVYLVLAPYLVNIRKMDVDDACKTIVDYIDKCKAVDPSTRITSQQIMYLCKWAKEKGKKPLSLEKARDLLSPVIDL